MSQSHAIAKFIAAGDATRAGRTMLKHPETFEHRMRRPGRRDQPILPRERWLRGSSGRSLSFSPDTGFLDQ